MLQVLYDFLGMTGTGRDRANGRCLTALLKWEWGGGVGCFGAVKFLYRACSRGVLTKHVKCDTPTELSVDNPLAEETGVQPASAVNRRILMIFRGEVLPRCSPPLRGLR